MGQQPLRIRRIDQFCLGRIGRKPPEESLLCEASTRPTEMDHPSTGMTGLGFEHDTFPSQGFPPPIQNR